MRAAAAASNGFVGRPDPLAEQICRRFVDSVGCNVASAAVTVHGKQSLPNLLAVYLLPAPSPLRKLLSILMRASQSAGT